MMTSHARVQTSHASDYLIRLSRAWVRDFPGLVFDDTHAMIPLPGARFDLVAGNDFLDITLVANTDTQAVLLEHLLAGHLDSLSGGENLKYHWILQ